MRPSILLLIVAVAVPIGLCAGSASAQFQDQSFLFGRRTGPQAPWCSNENIGGGTVQEDCSFNSFEQCRRAAMGVNNTFCTQNPRYDLTVQPVRSKKGDRVRQ
jgi:hypothetical protein